jgi:2',3'-cyclic-nucleotide 2'-phosphodiesterase (5'-nucleotidase family)
MKKAYKILLLVCCVCLLFNITGSIAFENNTAKELTILFTHDLHSYFLPHRILTQEGKQLQQGGYAKLAYLIKEQRLLNRDKTLLVDGGDFSMGTLFHTSFMNEASELRLMGMMGYEAATLGNHDFDFHPEGLAKMLQTAKAKSRQLPALVASNVIFTQNDPGDASLKKAFADYRVKEYTIIERNGIRIGLFGVLGKDAADDTPFAKPITFADPIESSKKMVDILKNKEKVDLIICLSHSGTWADKKKSEDEILAREVPQIDVIISGHTHTILPQPIIIGKTIIVSSGCYGENLGKLKISYAPGKDIQLISYDLKNTTREIPDDQIIGAEIARYKKIVDRNFLGVHHLRFDQVIAESGFNMESLYSAYQNPRETGLGNMITDAYRAAIKKAEGKNYEYINFALQPLGLIRDSFQKGKITVADIFQVLSLGIGSDGQVGYPLAFYISGKELKDALEVHTTVAPLLKEDAYLQISGVKFTYNPHRIWFDRVTSAMVQEPDGYYKPLESGKLYRACANMYAAAMINFVGRASHGLLTVQPKDKNARPLPDIKSAVIYVDKTAAEPKELKEWLALAEYMQSFKDTDGNGILEIPEKYAKPEGRYEAQPSWNPVSLIAGGNAITYGALVIVLLLLGIFCLAVWLVLRRAYHSGARGN